MINNWYSEIELQKLFGLSQGEAYTIRCIRSGMTVKEISEYTHQSPKTIRTLIYRADDKMKKSTKTMELIAEKGNSDVEGIMYKMNAVKVLFKFAEKALGAKYVSTRNFDVLYGLNPNAPGDTLWTNNVLFRKADLFGTTSDKEADVKAEKLYQAYMSFPESERAFGYGSIVQVLENMYMKYDIIEG